MTSGGDIGWQSAEVFDTRGEAILAVVTIDRHGRPVEAPAAIVSSFGWAVPRALGGDIEALGDWRTTERSLTRSLDERLRPDDPDEAPVPLDEAVIQSAYDWLVTVLGLPPQLVRPPSYALRIYEAVGSAGSPEPPLLNSFYLGDLAMARDQLQRNAAARNLSLYLGAQPPPSRCDLLHNNAALAQTLRPNLIPVARWPAVNRSPLVLLQQVAVNVAHSGLQSGGILAVNGPPGTGKTTLLRDIAAALVADRARAMSEFDDPESAFESSGERLKAGNGWLQLYRVDPRIRGFEMLVASSNNRAVENVTAELPTRSAVAADAPELNYFKSLSDELLGRDTWGLFAAVLGNRANRNAFKQRFWWSRDFGMATYLAAASGMPQTIDVTDPKTGEIESRAPRIVSQEDAPRGRNEALRRWQQSRQSFKETLARAEEILGRLDDVYLRATRLATLFTEEQEAHEALCPCQSAVDATVAEIDDVRNALRDAQVIRDSASSDQERRKREKPGLIACIFRTQRYRCWREATNAAHLAVSRATTELNRLKDLEGEAERALDCTRLALEAALKRLTRAETLRQDAHRSINAARDEIGKHFIDSSTFQLPHEALHQLSPWLDEVSQRARDAVFIAAMSLHKAFIDAAAKPLRHNIGALMKVFGGANLVGATKEALVPDLWASLFLVVPVVSTTFASVERMLGALPPESFGWLLIDEAGQALPQAAVGALMRTKRAVVVGDPMQIEPIVVLPDTLTETICRRFGVDPTRFNAPLASAQTLADDASPYYAEFPSRHGDRTVGVPLLVHRRCGKPMFSIANAIAYEGLMVFAKRPSESAIREVLGKSQWFDVQGTAEEKWCPEEGEIVVELLRQLAQMAVKPNIYIVTPFVVVQQNLRQLIRKSAVLEGWVPNPNDWLRERIGTVHVVQGREAEAVILVLGAPGPHQGGARGWAGGRPNLLNVAVTRAKEEIYVVGNRQLWREAGVFKELDTRMRMQNDQYHDRMRPAAR